MLIFIGLQIILFFMARIIGRRRYLISGSIGRKKLCILSSALLVFTMGLRSPLIGSDMPGYLYGFDVVSNIGFFESFHTQIYNFDTGFIVFSKIISMLSKNSQIYILACALMAIVPIGVWIYRKSSDPYLSFIIFTAMPSFFWVSSALRQSCAVALCALALDAVQDKKLKRFIVMVVLASCFHFAAIVFFLCYHLYWVKINRQNRLILCWFLVFIFIFREAIYNVLRFVMGRSEYKIDNNGAVSLMMLYILIYLLCIWLGNKDELQNGMMNIFFIACVTQIIANVGQMAGRITQFYAFTLVLLIPNVIMKLRIQMNRKILYYASLSFYSLFCIYICRSLGPGSSYFFWT